MTTPEGLLVSGFITRFVSVRLTFHCRLRASAATRLTCSALNVLHNAVPQIGFVRDAPAIRWHIEGSENLERVCYCFDVKRYRQGLPKKKSLSVRISLFDRHPRVTNCQKRHRRNQRAGAFRVPVKSPPQIGLARRLSIHKAGVNKNRNQASCRSPPNPVQPPPRWSTDAFGE